jgi:hypothetical protein
MYTFRSLLNASPRAFNAIAARVKETAVLVLVVAQCGCSQVSSGSARQLSTNQVASSKSDARSHAQASDSLLHLIKSLAAMHTTFAHPVYDTATWIYSGESSSTFRAITAFRRNAIGPLVECIGDTSLTQTTLSGRRVLLGVLCYEALSRIVSHEATDASGDLDPNWPGYLAPDAGASDLRRAWQAWLVVLHSGDYNLI